jgi:hypothetical protein
MTPIRVLAVVLAAALAPYPAAGERDRSLEGRLSPDAVELRPAAPPPLRLAERSGALPLARLGPATEQAAAELEAVASWNRARRTPARNGFARPLPEAQAVELGADLQVRLGAHAGGLIERRADGSVVWGAEVRVEGAYRLRLHLSQLELPAASLLWVYGADDATGPFGLELQAPAGDLWTPSVGGEAIRLEVLLPAGSAGGRFVLDRVAELFRLGAEGEPLAGSLEPRGVDLSCLVDAQCVGPGTFGPINDVQRGIGHLNFIDGVSEVFFFICSGGLLNNATSSLIPYLLTANHCFNEQVSASSLEVFWDDFSAVCGGPPPPLGSLPKSNGATLLTSSAVSDFTLVRLNSVPSNRYFLGSNPNSAVVGHNTVLHRISHPNDLNQHYSRNHVDTGFTAAGCQNFLPRPKFLYETFLPLMGDQGGTFGGSSGAPAMLSNGQVVGQLLGACGVNPEEGCDYSNREIDGAYSKSFDSGVGGVLFDTIRLLGGRFEVEMTWRGASPPNNVTRPARVGPGGTDFSGNFYFLNPRNSEVLIKVLNNCSFNNRFWVFAAATTNVEYTITVTDTQTSAVRTYFNPLGNPAQPIQDTSAFATCP